MLWNWSSFCIWFYLTWCGQLCVVGRTWLSCVCSTLSSSCSMFRSSACLERWSSSFCWGDWTVVLEPCVMTLNFLFASNSFTSSVENTKLFRNTHCWCVFRSLTHLLFLCGLTVCSWNKSVVLMCDFKNNGQILRVCNFCTHPSNHMLVAVKDIACLHFLLFFTKFTP